MAEELFVSTVLCLVFGVLILSIVSSEPILKEGFWDHGRFFGTTCKNKYLLPIDGVSASRTSGRVTYTIQFETQRMDMFNYFFKIARNQITSSAPVFHSAEQDLRIMDLGTGSGIWAIETSDE